MKKVLNDFYCVVCGKGLDAVQERPCTVLTKCPKCKNKIIADIDEHGTKRVRVPALELKVISAADESLLPKL